MVRWAFVLFVFTGLVAWASFYDLGDKPLAAHLAEVYRSDVVQSKITALGRGLHRTVDDLTTKAKTLIDGRAGRTRPAKPRERQKTAMSTPMTAAPGVVDARPSKIDREPAHDLLTEQDRQGLDQLLAEKLH